MPAQMKTCDDGTRVRAFFYRLSAFTYQVSFDVYFSIKIINRFVVEDGNVANRNT